MTEYRDQREEAKRRAPDRFALASGYHGVTIALLMVHGIISTVATHLTAVNATLRTADRYFGILFPDAGGNPSATAVSRGVQRTRRIGLIMVDAARRAYHGFY